MKVLKRILGRPISLGSRFLVLGMDGLDPDIIDEGMKNGDLPNFRTLANRGSFSELQTTWMPLSPVAWSSFISGCNPGTHGIFDFLHRDPGDYDSKLSIARQQGSPRSLEFGPVSLPLGSSHTEKGRKGPAYWTESSRQGVRTTVLRCPVSFPPEPVRGRMLSGLGVPDLRGTQGSFTFFTTNQNTDVSSRAGDVKRIDHPKGDSVTVTITGPPNPFLRDHPPTQKNIHLESHDEVLQLTIGDRSWTLEPEQWTDWIPLDFPFLGPMSAEGQVRFYLQSLAPEFELYCSPVNVSPRDPAFPISYPSTYSEELTNHIGRFHTLGLTADTGVLKEDRVDEVTFLEQTHTVLEERIEMLKHELSRFDDGLFTCVFDIPDRIQHMFWRFRDPLHPLHTSQGAEQYGDVVGGIYRKMDSVLGWVHDHMDDEDELVICSDHGFSSFRREFDVNRWLVEEGYMTLQDGSSPEDCGLLFQGVDWSETRAYSLGLAGIYINLEGRETKGIVPPEEGRQLIEEIADQLEHLEDSSEEARVVSRARPSSEVYSGEQMGQSPDLLVGYMPGYRASWDSVLGGMGRRTLSANRNPWSGDHCLDPDRIPGSLLTSFSRSNDSDIHIRDVMPSVLNRLDLDDGGKMEGESDKFQR